jgi:hypothetical protein
VYCNVGGRYQLLLIFGTAAFCNWATQIQHLSQNIQFLLLPNAAQNNGIRLTVTISDGLAS